MRRGSKSPSDSNFYNKEVALNEILAGTGGGLSTATLSSVNDSASSVTLLSSNPDRKGTIIYNDSTEILYVALGTTASVTAFSYRLVPTGTLELFGSQNFTGQINGIWANNASGAARITELEN